MYECCLLDMLAMQAHTVCMTNIQYTLRSIPSRLDQRLRSRAARNGKSLNALVIETLSRAEGLDGPKQAHADLDWFVGGKKLDSGMFDEILREQRAIDPTLWR